MISSYPKEVSGMHQPVPVRGAHGVVKQLDLNKVIDRQQTESSDGYPTSVTPPLNSPDSGHGKLRRMVSLARVPFEKMFGRAPSPQPTATNTSPPPTTPDPVSPTSERRSISRLPSGEASWARECLDRYAVSSRPLGSGTYGKVYRGRVVATGEYVAIKVFERNGARPTHDASAYQHYLNEVDALERIAQNPHPNVIQIVAHYMTDRSPRIVMELCQVSLLDVLRSDPDARFITEEHYREVLRQGFAALDHCLKLGVYHQDIKLENFMFAVNPVMVDRNSPTLLRVNREALRTVRIIDWGFSMVRPALADDGFSPRLPLRSYANVGSEHYSAPEIGEAAAYSYDVGQALPWSLGVCLYCCICRRLPWSLRKDEYRSWGLRDAGQYPNLDGMASPLALHLLSQLIQVRPSDRLTVEQALQHPWFQSSDLSNRVSPGDSVAVESPEEEMEATQQPIKVSRSLDHPKHATNRVVRVYP